MESGCDRDILGHRLDLNQGVYLLSKFITTICSTTLSCRFITRMRGLSQSKDYVVMLLMEGY